MITTTPLATKAIQSLRLLSNQIISHAGSGHPGIALGAAPILYELYANQLNVDPKNPHEPNRDRFVLSAGHGAALLYATLYAAGFNLTSKDLSEFRQPHSKTPGHPEVGVTPGVEATTGPLGQGLGMAVGMAMAEEKLHQQFPTVIHHFTYALVGDGDLMEGVSHEVASLAGQQRLSKLIVLYDDNAVSLDGAKERSDTSDNLARFASYGWDIRKVENGNNLEAIHDAIENAKLSPEPTLIAVKSIIGDFGPFAGTNKAHGTPLTDQQLVDLSEMLAVKVTNFELPSDVLEDIRIKIMARLANRVQPTEEELGNYFEFTRKKDFSIPQLTTEIKSQAGRKISKYVLQNFAQQLPNLWGGSADLVASTNAEIVQSPLFNNDDRSGRNIAFGVREFGMGSVMNGIALHGGTTIFGATFLAFSDYMKAAIRLSALQHVPVIYVFTHDSVTVGEDGPTHQPVEQLMGLRMIPGIDVLRPGTAEEIAHAWHQALTSIDRPTVLILSRGAIGPQGNDAQAELAIQKGAVQLRQNNDAKINLIATGSEVQLAQKVSELLSVPSNIISIPNLSRFSALEKSERHKIIPQETAKNVIIEAGTTLGWQGIAGDEGMILGIDEFGMSAAAANIFDEIGFTAESIVHRITRELL